MQDLVMINIVMMFVGFLQNIVIIICKRKYRCMISIYWDSLVSTNHYYQCNYHCDEAVFLTKRFYFVWIVKTFWFFLQINTLIFTIIVSNILNKMIIFLFVWIINGIVSSKYDDVIFLFALLRHFSISANQHYHYLLSSW